MPVSYGQVAGIKHFNTQTPYDPDNPKPSRYQPKTRRPAVMPVLGPKPFRHGITGWQKGCRCDECSLAHDRKLERDRERYREKRTETIWKR